MKSIDKNKKIKTFSPDEGETDAPKYVSALIGDDYLNWKDGQKILIATPTGSGKTTFVINALFRHAVSKGMYMVYICNRNVLNDQFKHQADQKIRSMFQGSDGITSDMVLDYLLIYTYQSLETYKCFPPVPIYDYYEHKTKLLPSEQILYYVFDEAHYFVNDAAFNSKTNFWTERMTSFPRHSKYVFLTATPEPLIAFLNRERIASLQQQRVLHDTYSKIGKFLGKDKEKIVSQVSLILSNFSGHYDSDSISIKLPSVAKMVQLLRQDIDTTLQPFFQELNASIEEYASLDHVYSYKPDYSHITAKYFKRYNDLITEIINSGQQKWLIFIDNEKDGHTLQEQLQEQGEVDVGFLSRHEISTKAYAQEIYNSIVTDESFSCRILITTSVLDCGININDDLLTNIVISSDNKATFLQMLGRKRVDKRAEIQLFIKVYGSRTINVRSQKYKQDLRTLNTLSLKNDTTTHGSFLSLIELNRLGASFNSISNSLWYKSDTDGENNPLYRSSIPLKELTIQCPELFLYGIKYSQTGFLYRLLQLQEFELAINRPRITNQNFLDFFNYVKSAVNTMDWISPDPNSWPYIFSFYGTSEKTHLTPDLRDNLIESYKAHNIKRISTKTKASENPYLERQLSWLGKEYHKAYWVRPEEKMEALEEFLLAHSGIPLTPEVFAREFLPYIKALPQIPPVIKNDISRYSDGKKSPGKNKIEKVFKELDLCYEIVSKQKQINGKRKTIWYLKYDSVAGLLRK